MGNGLVIADAGPIFSLAIIDRLELLDQIFDDIRIPRAVWEEISLVKTVSFYKSIQDYFQTKVIDIKGFNDLTLIMDKGESESIILFKELDADFILIDDKKARNIAESLDVTCVGTLGILSIAKSKGLIKELRPLFIVFLNNDRYYSLKLLNMLLEKHDEALISNKQ